LDGFGTNGNLNNHIKQTNWTVPTGTQAVVGAFISLRLKPEAMMFCVPNGTLGINLKGRKNSRSNQLPIIWKDTF